jgi:hypothetical protein
MVVAGLKLPGTSGNYASAPDSAAVSVTGDIDVWCRVALTDWTPGTQQSLVAHYNSAAQRGYLLSVNTDGTLIGTWSTAGTAGLTATSTVATGAADGSILWVRWTMDVDNGASGRTHKFYTSTLTSPTTSSSDWTQLGTTVTQGTVTSIFNSNAALEVGSNNAGAANNSTGIFYRAIVRNGYDGAGSVQFDADFSSLGRWDDVH